MTVINPEYARVRDCVAEMMGVVPGAMVSQGRRREIAHIRQIGYWVMRESFPNIGLPLIGKIFGGRHHTTILYGIRKVEDRRSSDPDFREVIDAILDRIDAPEAVTILTDELRASIERAALKYYPKTQPSQPLEIRRDVALGLDEDAQKRAAGSRRLSDALANAMQAVAS